MRQRRVLMVDARTLELEGEQTQRYASGDYYMVAADVAAQWIAEDAAIDPNEPPVCALCGEAFGSRRSLAAHTAESHAPAVERESVPEAEGLPLDAEDPAVAALLGMRRSALRALAHRLGYSLADVRASGRDGRPTKADWIRAILRARGYKTTTETTTG